MDYFSWLSLTRKEDTRENFVLYLIEILDYKEEDAEHYAKFYF